VHRIEQNKETFIMRRTHVVGGIGFLCLTGLLLAGAGSALAGAPRAAGTLHGAAQALNPAPRTWHVIAGFSQALPANNGNNESVNQFYPRTLTIYPGDKVVFTDNEVNEPHTVTFGPDALLRPLEDPRNAAFPRVINGRQVLVLNPKKWFPSAPGPLVETDTGAATHLLNCGLIGPAGTPNPQSCTVTFPHVGTYSYECLLHSGVPGNPDMDGVIKVTPRPQPVNRTWTVWAGPGTTTDALNGFVPSHLIIHVGDRVTWQSSGVHYHTVSFGLDPLKTPQVVPVGKDAHGAPIMAFNPRAFFPILPKNGVYLGGVASSGIVGLTGNYLNLPGQAFLKAPFTLRFGRPGTYTYYCLVHGPLMKGTITVLPATGGAT
jgi:plastocyanin